MSTVICGKTNCRRAVLSVITDSPFFVGRADYFTSRQGNLGPSIDFAIEQFDQFRSSLTPPDFALVTFLPFWHERFGSLDKDWLSVGA